MKTRNAIIALALLVAAAFLFSSSTTPLQAQSNPDSSDKPYITVSGNAEVRVVPDEVVLTLGVETWSENLASAKEQNDARVKKIIAAAKERGIESKNIQTDYIDISPRYEYEYEKRRFIGYFVRKTVVITLRDITRFEDLLTDVLGSANYVHGIEFRTTELRKYKDQARSLAIKAAKEKAEAMSQELGQKVGKPHRINEDQVYWWSGYRSWWGSSWGGGMQAQNVVQESRGGAPDSDESAIAPGQIAVNARVTVEFELE